MQNAKHTPRPWEIGSNYVVRWKEKWRTIFGHNEKGGLEIVAYGRPVENETQEMVANAQLIAAAPDMLEALHFCRSVIKSQGMFDRSEQLAFEKASYALANATGDDSYINE